MGKEKCACPSDKSCQRFTGLNRISTSPRQLYRGFVALYVFYTEISILKEKKEKDTGNLQLNILSSEKALPTCALCVSIFNISK